jgi:asparagine synthase (glutamine-hydrolysing)
VARDFFAVLWDTGAPAQAETAMRINAALASLCPHLDLRASAVGLRFYTSRANAARTTVNKLRGGSCLVYGTIFRRGGDDTADPSPCCINLCHKDAERILDSGGQHLVDHYWGHYVLFLVNDVSRTRWVFRSPACHQPCLYAVHEGVRLYFSAVEDLAALGLMRLSTNWDFVAAFSAFARTSGSETGLNEIRQLNTGEYHESSPKGDGRGFRWNPATFAKCLSGETTDKSRRLLRATVLSCTSAWAGEHRSILQHLSGGLDSSIATVCLALSPTRPEVTCLNYYSRGTHGDEREYARAVCDKVGFALVEHRQDSASPMDRLLTYRRTESPAAYVTRDARELEEMRLARRLGVNARFTGMFGDALFHMPPVAPVVADYVRQRGIDRRYLETAFLAAQMDRVSIWSILQGSLTKGLFVPPRSFVPGDFGKPNDSLLTREALESVCHTNPLRFAHPWLHDLDGVPCGKFPVISSLSWNSTYCNALAEADEPELIHPYFSEPLAELCLRLPTYSMLRDGWDRALVREAFASELPEVIARRVSKGSANLHVRERITHNEQFIREVLTDGALVKQGLLDRRRIADSLPGRVTRGGCAPLHLWACVAAEAWCRAWSTQPAPTG